MREKQERERQEGEVREREREASKRRELLMKVLMIKDCPTTRLF